MDATTWTIIGTAIGLFVALSAVMQLLTTSLKNELRAEFKQGLAENRAEFKQDLAEHRAEFKQEMAEFRQVLAASNADLSSKIQANRTEIIANRRILYRLSLHRHGADGLPVAPLTDALDPPDFGSGSDNGEGGNPPA